MSSLCFVQRIFDWVEGNGFGRRGRRKDWRKIASNYVAVISKQTLGHFNKLDLTDTFE